MPSTSPRIGFIAFRAIQLSGSLNKRGIYSLYLKRNRDQTELCEPFRCTDDTATPDWRGQHDVCLYLPAGTHTLKLEVHRAKSGLWASAGEMVGKVEVPLHVLYSEVPCPFRLSIPPPSSSGSSPDDRSPGSVVICLVPSVTGEIDVRGHRENIKEQRALRALYMVFGVLDTAKTPFKDTTASASIKAGRVFTGTALQYLCQNPALVPTNVEALDRNVVWDLSRQLEIQLHYFQNEFCNSLRQTPRAKTDLAQELFPVVAGSLTIIFGFLNVYQSASYHYVNAASPLIAEAAFDLQFKLIVISASMRDIASTPLTVPKDTFFCELARLYASKFKNVKKQKLSGPWIDFMDCMHGKLAISMLDGYKAFIDNSAATNKSGSAELRNTARRLMAMLAHNTQMLPSGLEIPEKLIGKEEPRKPRAEGEAGMDVDGHDGASGSYGDVMFTMMKCRRRGTDIRVAIKSIKASATPEEIKHTYLEIISGWTLRHPCLLATEGITHRNRQINIISQHMEGGTAWKYVRDVGTFGKKKAQQKVRLLNLWLKQIADGIKYMHDEGVVHGDLRGANIFLKTDHNVVIGDFGLSIYVDAASNAFNSTRSGNERYLAPELSMPTVTDDELKNNTALYGVPTELISRSNRPSKASDLFSFAMLCVELYTQDKPFKNLKDGTVSVQILQGKRPNFPAILAEQQVLPGRIQTCWNQNPGARGDANGLLEDMRRAAPYDRP